MNLYFLGTGAGVPSKKRNVTSIALQMLQERGSTWLFDCGEATQHQILHTNIRPRRIEKIFITHLHGDHIFGLPGFLGSRSFQGGDSTLTIYGPKGIQAYVETALAISGTNLTYGLEFYEVEEGIIYEDDYCTVTCYKLDHVITSFGYCIQEHDKPGELLVDKLRAQGVPPGPIYQQIKENPVVTFEGNVLHREDYLGEQKSGRKVCILGDTRYMNKLKDFVKDADVLVHEATFSKNETDLAYNYFHSTTQQAAQLASDANVKELILTHISSRYQDDDLEELVNEAREQFANTKIATDFSQFPVL
ncbi:ribonuclease Z [Pontibacillus yanchengensis]|uniref:Ribonuclease Z n=1 Tax=Pontibacillus yanchengensis Y32 TaxID=1385514 RepID=A0A0A2TCS9_9BACI|nr:ribonuclease Z [Pontibacillus yanchengensis]KGP73329.1 ribonuclease Z [Pontibacillus yanchengensis Y32]